MMIAAPLTIVARGPRRATTVSPDSRKMAMATEKPAKPAPAPATPACLTVDEEQRAPVGDRALDGEGQKGQHAQGEGRAVGEGEVRPGMGGVALGHRLGMATIARTRRTPAATVAPLPSPQPAAMMAAPSPAPSRAPSEKKPWKDDIVGRPRAASTSVACTFMDTSSAPIVVPKMKRPRRRAERCRPAAAAA